jgi:hypothetical protein
MDKMNQEMGTKAKIKAILNIMDQMDELELEGLRGDEEKPVGVTMVSVEKKKPNMEMSEESEYPEESEMDATEDMAEGEMPEMEEEEDSSSALGKLRKRLKGVA